MTFTVAEDLKSLNWLYWTWYFVALEFFSQVTSIFPGAGLLRDTIEGLVSRQMTADLYRVLTPVVPRA